MEALELEIGMSDGDAEALSEALGRFGELRELGLGSNCIGDVGCVAIAGQLVALTKLERLSLKESEYPN